MYYTYLLRSEENNQLCIGSANDLRKRIKDHNNGKESSAKQYKPWQILYYEAYHSEFLARIREKRLKYHGNALRELKERLGDFIHKSGTGFTLIEMIVVMGIIVFITALSFTSYKEGQSQYALQLSAQKLAADLRMAQNMALSTVVTSGGQVSGEGCGIYFDKIQDKNLAYTLFTDNDADSPKVYAPLLDRIIEIIKLKKGVEISAIFLDGNNAGSDSYIIFTPPDPQITIGSGGSTGFTELRIKIVLAKDLDRSKTVIINKFGKIDISD